MVMLLSEISKFKGAIQSVTFILTNADKFDEQYLDNCKNRLGFIVKNFKQFRANIQLPHDNSDKENLFLSETATEDDSQNLILVLNQNNSNYQKVNNIFYSAYHVVMQIRYIKHDKDYMHTCVIADLFPFYFKIKTMPVLAISGNKSLSTKAKRKGFGDLFSENISFKHGKEKNEIHKPNEQGNEENDWQKSEEEPAIPIQSHKTFEISPKIKDLFYLEISGRTYYLLKRPNADDFEYKDHSDRETENKRLKQKNTVKTENLSDEDFFNSFFQSEDESQSAPESQADKEPLIEDDAFTLVGKDIEIPVKLCGNPSDVASQYLAAQSLIFDKRLGLENYILATGSELILTRNRTPYAKALSCSLKGNESENYLKLWDTYSCMEMYLNIRKCINFGTSTIDSFEKTFDGYKVNLTSLVNVADIAGDTIINVGSIPPTYLNHAEDFKSFDINHVRNIFKKTANELESTPPKAQDYIKLTKVEQATELMRNKGKAKYYSFKLALPPNSRKEVDQLHLLSLDDSSLINAGDHIWMSVSGDKQQFLRRMHARELVKNYEAQKPNLLYLIEDNEEAAQFLKNHDRINIDQPLPERISKKIFPTHAPTKTQLEAINIALNTPDIAIIQGPPGTGKTTVITAIIESLTEKLNNSESAKGQILVSGFQHDAVENIISRLSINSLPALKFGEKNGTDEWDTRSMRRIERWSLEKAKLIREKNPKVAENDKIRAWNILCSKYLLSPDTDTEKMLLTSIIKNPQIFDSSLKDEARNLLAECKVAGKVRGKQLRHALNNLRTSKNAFLDDGIEKCKLLKQRLERPDTELFTDIRGFIETLDKAESYANATEEEIKVYVEKLKVIKETLLYQLLPEPEIIQDKANPKVTLLCTKVRENLKKRFYDKDTEENILSDFLMDLESNPIGVKKAIEDYLLVYAATTQQSMGRLIQDAKTSNSRDEISYDTVIIDEAARANPADLLIPMVQAKNRIILVGDHRQLPQLVDPEIETALRADGVFDNGTENYLEISMFEYLFSRLKKLEKFDGHRRTITLDAQYRTNPVLGEFCSKMFYESKNPSEKYGSPLPKTLFEQHLPHIEGASCCWINVPYFEEYKPIRNSSGSYTRQKEAFMSANLLARWLKSEESNGLSFGIITFYRGQVDVIYEELFKLGIAQKVSEGKQSKYKINDEYAYDEKGRERLRIGTVDAFQGMEFDVVLLSLVRTLPKDKIENLAEQYKDDERKRINSIAGFLTSENRLCVSMSRQKKVLCVVGDSDYVRHPLMAKIVPSLNEFYNLCCTHEGKVLG